MRSGRPLQPLLTGIGLVFLLFASTAWLTFHDMNQDSDLKYQLSRSHRILTYRLSEIDETLFRVHPRDRQLEVITNLDLPPSTQLNPDLEVDYAIAVDILNLDHQVMRSEVFWERTRWSRWKDSGTVLPMMSAFYLHEPEIPADSRITTLYLNENRREDVLVSIRLLEPDDAGASVRVYHNEEFSRTGEINPLKFLTKRFKAKLARHNLYGYRYRDSEVWRSLSNIWKQVPAEGRSGWDYQVRNLFLYDHALPIQGIPVPESDIIDSQNPLLKQTNYYQILPESTHEQVTLKLESMFNGEHRPFKAVCRVPGLESDRDRDMKFSVNYVFSDSAGRIIQNGSFQGHTTVSEFAMYSDATSFSSLNLSPSSPVSFIICPPAEADSVSFHAAIPVEAAFFTYIPSEDSKPRVITVSDQSDSGSSTGYYGQAEDKVEKKWYFFRPFNDEVLRTENRLRTIRLPAGIREIQRDFTEDRVPDTRVARSLYPMSYHHREYLYSETSSDDPYTAYIEFHGSETSEFHMKNTLNLSETLAFRYFLEDTGQPWIHVLVDGITSQYFRPVTLAGCFEIPEIGPGNHTISFKSSSENDRFYLRASLNTVFEKARLKSRKVFRINPGESMRVMLDKSGWSSSGINILAYQTPDQTGALNFRVSAETIPDLIPGKVVTCMTSKTIEFKTTTGVHPGSELKKSEHFLRSGCIMTDPLRMFFPLHDDVPPARYPVVIQSRSDEPVYLRFFTMDSSSG